MDKKIFICTGNKYKIMELIEFCKLHYNEYRPVLLVELGTSFDEIEEVGLTYEENSKIKALDYKRQLENKNIFGKEDLAIAEDSGIEGENVNYPGIYSKREVSLHGLIPVLEKIIELNNGNDVFYTSNISVINSNEEIISREAYEHGLLLLEPKGKNNYYLDRYFISKTRGPLGELDSETYLKTSFRLKAK